MPKPPTSRKVRGGTVAKAEHAALVADRKASRMGPDGKPLAHRPRTTARDALVAMQYKQLTDAAPAILKRLVQGALDVGDPYHERCLDLVAKRLMPMAFWEHLGKQEFREDGEGSNRPVFVINVGAASLPDTNIQTVDVQAREREETE